MPKSHHGFMRGMQMKWYVFLILLFSIATISAGCTATKITSFDLVDYGIIAAKEKEWKKTKDPNFGRTHIVKFSEIKEETTDVPAEIGTRFGFRYKINGEPQGKNIIVQYEGIHPQLSNPRTGKTYSSYKYSQKVKIGKIKYTGFKFDHEWELKPGDWTLRVLYQDKVMIEKVFNVHQ